MEQAEYDLLEMEMPQGLAMGRLRYWASAILLVCFYYTIPIIKTPLGYTTYVRLDDLASFFFVLVSLSAILNRDKLPETKFVPIMVIVLVFALPSAVWGYMLGGILKNLQLGLWQMVRYFRIFAIFMAVMVLPVDESRFRRIMLLVWLGSIFVGIYGALQYYGFLSARALAAKFVESGPWEHLYKFEKTALGPLSHNHACLGAYMVVAVFVALFLSRTAWGVTKIVYLASVPFFMLVILWSRSRADFFGVFVGLVTYMLLSKVRPAAIIGFIGAVIATYIVLNMVPELRERFLGTGGGSLIEYSAGRFVGWAKVLAYMFTRPIFWITGVGLGNFRWLYETNRVGLIAAHNNYLHWLTECGVFGLYLGSIFLIKIGRIIKWLSFYGPFHREVSISFLSLLFGLCAVAATQELFTPGPAMASAPAYIAFIFGYVVALYRAATIGSQFQEYQYASVESNVYG